MENLYLLEIGSIKLGIKAARKYGINLLVGQFARTLDDTLPNPCLFIRDCASVRMDFEDNTDCESIFARKQ
jgi:hypothetical protein